MISPKRNSAQTTLPMFLIGYSLGKHFIKLLKITLDVNVTRHALVNLSTATERQLCST